MPAVTRRPKSTVNATQKSGLHEYHGTAVERDEKRAVKEQTISVDRQSDSEADGQARQNEKTKKMRELGARNGGRQREKKEPRTEKTFLSRFPGLEILPSLLSRLYPTTRSMTGLASLPWRLGLWLDDKGELCSNGGLD